ncbi:MAG TPA: MarC family protein [Bacteroidetes bacterium]|nr:MarC family protein [Bacteroidota bacterium]
MKLTAIFTVSLILFSVIDIIGSLPVIIDMKREGVKIKAGLATVSAAIIMFAFLFFGAAILHVFGIGVSSFALAGSLIILFIGLEMILGIRIFRNLHEEGGSGSIVPIAFPLVAGAGTLTTIISLKAEYGYSSLIVGIVLNLIFIFIILKSSDWISGKMSPQVVGTLRKVFGILLIAIAIQMFKENI